MWAMRSGASAPATSATVACPSCAVFGSVQ